MTTPMHPDAARTLALTRWRTPIGLVVDNLAPPALGYGSSTLAQLRHRNRLRSKHGFAGGDSRLEQHLHAFLRAA
jgi:hypothetical protein